LGPGPRLIKKNNLPGRGLTKVEKHWPRELSEKKSIASARNRATFPRLSSPWPTNPADCTLLAM